MRMEAISNIGYIVSLIQQQFAMKDIYVCIENMTINKSNNAESTTSVTYGDGRNQNRWFQINFKLKFHWNV